MEITEQLILKSKKWFFSSNREVIILKIPCQELAGLTEFMYKVLLTFKVSGTLLCLKGYFNFIDYISECWIIVIKIAIMNITLLITK